MITFQEYLNTIKPQVDERIDQITRAKLKDPDIIPMLLKGKRLRAGLLLLTHDSLSQKPFNRNALDLACAIELAHSASLILDDMLDEDTQRRGLPTVHLKKGHKKAMLETIGVLSLPYDLVAPYGTRYVESLAEIQRGMVRGVFSELFHSPDLPATKIYDVIIAKKTGFLFALAAMWGCGAAYCPGCKCLDQYCAYQGEFVRLIKYGLHCGKAMQIADDIADLKQIIEGKKTSGFGSEMLLLRCMNVDRLIKEFFMDVKDRSLQLSKAKEILSQEGTQKTLRRVLDNEIKSASEDLWELKVQTGIFELLVNAPQQIADIMLNEE